MTTAQHTPGPWWPSQNTAGAWSVLTYRDHQTPDEAGAIASAYGAFICSNIGDHTEQRTRGNEAANARLIAAAPDMLEALRALATYMRGDLTTDDFKSLGLKRGDMAGNVRRIAENVLTRIDGEAAP